MAILSRDEFFSRINDVIGERSDEQSISFIEDMSDTYNDMENRATNDTDWKTKYEENDADWRQKYRDRFFNTGGDDKDKELPPDDTDKPKKLRFEDLFKEG